MLSAPGRAGRAAPGQIVRCPFGVGFHHLAFFEDFLLSLDLSMQLALGRAVRVHTPVGLQALGLLVGAQAGLHCGASGRQRLPDPGDGRRIAEPGEIALGLEQVAMGIDAARADRLPDARRRHRGDRRAAGARAAIAAALAAVPAVRRSGCCCALRQFPQFRSRLHAAVRRSPGRHGCRAGRGAAINLVGRNRPAAPIRVERRREGAFGRAAGPGDAVGIEAGVNLEAAQGAAEAGHVAVGRVRFGEGRHRPGVGQPGIEPGRPFEPAAEPGQIVLVVAFAGADPVGEGVIVYMFCSF